MQPLIHARDIQGTPHPGHYSHYALSSGLMFISGLLPVTPAGEMRNTASFAEQTCAGVGQSGGLPAAGRPR
jgi:enamine deaminase RidA (YjgF/YER057c/UK114 family)